MPPIIAQFGQYTTYLALFESYYADVPLCLKLIRDKYTFLTIFDFSETYQNMLYLCYNHIYCNDKLVLYSKL